jgi:hypothetical protein
MARIKKASAHWHLEGGALQLRIAKATGSLSALTIMHGKKFAWTHYPGDVTVRDDLLRKTFDTRDLKHVTFGRKDDVLSVRKRFRGAPWVLEESYSAGEESIHWQAKVILERGDFRSCAVSFAIPWPQPLYPMRFWAAKENMPSAPHRFAEISLEYAEVTSGILLPALSSYLEKEDAGLLLAMPFDFKTPRFSFVSAYREPCLQARFDWMALAPGRPAETSLLLRGTRGSWRPALGWLYERFKEYFEPRSSLIHSLWGGHVSGQCDVSLEEAEAMAELGLIWHEIHVHFPAYGNYHPEGVKKWRSGHDLNFKKLISPAMIRRTIKNLHAAGSAALPYIQVSGDGNMKLLDAAFKGSRVKDVHGDLISDGTHCQMNSDPSLPFGKDMTRQIDGMIRRYPDIDGVFLDQPCYNFLDSAHDDGITAVDNRPCYMTGFNYYPHLEHLSRLLHPDKVIIGNAPYSIGIMKYIDGYMAEHVGWLPDHLQYYGLAKPMFFLCYDTADRDIELMFQNCLIYAAGYTSYAEAKPSKDLYDKYLPLLERLFRRRWVFEANPMQLPSGFRGNLYRGEKGSLLAGIVSVAPRIGGRKVPDNSVRVSTSDIEEVKNVKIQEAGKRVRRIPFKRESGGVQFSIPGGTVAAVAELEF